MAAPMRRKVSNPFDFVKRTAPNVFLSVSGPFDIQTGTFLKGERGEYVLNGGLQPMVVMAGEPNVGKTTLIQFMALQVMARYNSVEMLYDSEGTGNEQRVEMLSTYVDGIDGAEIIAEETRMVFRSDNKVDGPEWYKGLNDWAKDVTKSGHESRMVETTMLDGSGEVIKTLPKHTGIVDSITYLKTEDNVDKLMELDPDDGKKMTMAMASGRAQSDIVNQMLVTSSRFGMNFLIGAHVGTTIKVDRYAPDPRQLKGLKNGMKLRGGGKAIADLPHSIWYVQSNVQYNNSTKDKTPRYPRKETLQHKEDPDLRQQEVLNLRGKSGLTNLVFPVVLSQSQGIMVGLTNYDCIRDYKDWGVNVLKTNKLFELDLLPGKTWMRTTIREKIEGNSRDIALFNAMQYTYDICYMQHHLPTWVDYYQPTAAIRDSLLAQGYDLEFLFSNCRHFHLYKEDEKYFKEGYLSALDIMRMAHGLYVPYWFSKDMAKTIDTSKAIIS